MEKDQDEMKMELKNPTTRLENKRNIAGKINKAKIDYQESKTKDLDQISKEYKKKFQKNNTGKEHTGNIGHNETTKIQHSKHRSRRS